MVESCTVTSSPWRMATPKSPFGWCTSTFLTTTCAAVTSTVAAVEMPDTTAPSVSAAIQPRVSQCQPGPRVMSCGTRLSAVPAGTPVLVPSGYPQADGRPAQSFGCPADWPPDGRDAVGADCPQAVTWAVPASATATAATTSSGR